MKLLESNMKLSELIDAKIDDNTDLLIYDIDHKKIMVVTPSIGKSTKPFYEASKKAEIIYLSPVNDDDDDTSDSKDLSIAVKVKGLNYVSDNPTVIED